MLNRRVLCSNDRERKLTEMAVQERAEYEEILKWQREQEKARELANKQMQEHLYRSL